MVVKKKKGFKPSAPLTRKQQRKEKRKAKKVRKNEYYTNRNKSGKPTPESNLESNVERIENNEKTKNNDKKIKKPKSKLGKDISEKIRDTNKILSTEDQRKKEMREQKKLQKEMEKQRREQLLEANKEEDENIRRLEKQLKLNKRKSKTIPKSFGIDGLDYLLEVCGSENMEGIVSAEKQLQDVNDEFDEDLELITGKPPKQDKKKKIDKHEDDDFEDFLNEDDGSDEDFDEKETYSDVDEEYSGDEDEDEAQVNFDEDEENSDEDEAYAIEDKAEDASKSKKRIVNNNTKGKNKKGKNINNEISEDEEEDIYTDSDQLSEDSSDEDTEIKKKGKKRQTTTEENENIKAKKSKKSKNEDELDDEEFSEDNNLSDDANSELLEDDEGSLKKGATKVNPDGTWEDIYGRLRSKDGSVLSQTEEKYIPPAIRARKENESIGDKKRLEKLNRLRKQLKGLLNRLAESNMHSIASQLEDLYMNNSRNDMNETLTSLVLDSLASNVTTPKRLLMEHVLLVVILHANIGIEIGAHFLQTVIKKFDECFKSNHEVENKTLDNLVRILAQLYNFRLFDAKLLYEILHKLSEKFEEKDVECILHILSDVGFTLRKDDPLALKNLIMELQKQAASVSQKNLDNSRVKYMLDILMAIKNNNVTKIPNYDTSYSEHLKKIMKSFIRKGNYVTPLNIALDDLLKAEERGKWWVVGSAWTGITELNENTKEKKSDGFSQKLLELARKQRMNTDTRRNIFCILMSAEDYLDAFEKLLKLGLKNQQEREIIHVILHCCLQEKTFNPYYAILAQKFCEYDRKYQMTIKCSVWDKLKTLNEHSGQQISNLSKLLTHLFVEKGLPISTLKIVEFSELDKVTLRFIRQVLLGILLHEDTESALAVFAKVAHVEKLKMFRESLRLFIHHFLLRNLKSESVVEDQKQLLEERSKLVEKILTTKENRLKF